MTSGLIVKSDHPQSFADLKQLFQELVAKVEKKAISFLQKFELIENSRAHLNGRQCNPFCSPISGQMPNREKVNIR